MLAIGREGQQDQHSEAENERYNDAVASSRREFFNILHGRSSSF
jgi:hypothetical protein